jgi:hypothetical protein
MEKNSSHPCFRCGSMFIGEGVICGYCQKRTQKQHKKFVERIIWFYNRTVGIIGLLLGEQTY